LDFFGSLERVISDISINKLVTGKLLCEAAQIIRVIFFRLLRFSKLISYT